MRWLGGVSSLSKTLSGDSEGIFAGRPRRRSVGRVVSVCSVFKLEAGSGVSPTEAMACKSSGLRM